jgi:hypothetical protein
MLRTSVAMAAFGVTGPIVVSSYWLPPSLLDLAQRTWFDIESFVFSFAIGGIGSCSKRAGAHPSARDVVRTA